MRHWKSILLISACTVMAVWPTLAIGQTGDCTTITFEGNGDYQPIGLVPGTVNVTFGTSWLSIIDSDAPGGTDGDFANEPSASTIAFLDNQDDITIVLDPPVQYAEFWYTASAGSVPLTVTAFDIGGVEVAQDIGNTIGSASDGADCQGDPNGDFCLWDLITLSTVGNKIASIQVVGAATHDFGIDDLQVCTGQLVACCLPDFSCVQVTEEECAAIGGLSVGVADCAEVNCEDPVAGDTSTWGSLKGLYR